LSAARASTIRFIRHPANGNHFLQLKVSEKQGGGSISRAYGSDDILDILRDKLTEALIKAGVMEGSGIGGSPSSG